MTPRYLDVRSHIVNQLLAMGGGARSSTLTALGASPRDLSRMCDDGTLLRPKRGFYVLNRVQAGERWQRIRSDHLRQLAATASCDALGGLRSASLAWEMLVSEIPVHPEVIRPPGSCTLANSRTIRRELPDSQVASIHGVPVTSLERTVVDVALDLPVPEALITADAALRRGVSQVDLLSVLESLGPVRGCQRARTTLDWADAHAESALESRGRGELMLRGVPRPGCNISFRIDDLEFRADKWWPAIPMIGEADGAVKYGDDNPRSLWEEKLRQEWLENTVGLRVFRYIDREVRWSPHDLITRFRRIAERAHEMGWTPPPELEIFQRPTPNSDQPIRWLKRRGEVAVRFCA